MSPVACAAPFPFNNSSSPHDADTDILKYPEIVKKPRKVAKSADKFFVLTSKEAFEAKLQHEREKASRDLIKQQRQAMKQKKNTEKLVTNSAKKKNESATASREMKKNPVECSKNRKGNPSLILVWYPWLCSQLVQIVSIISLLSCKM